MAPIRSRLLNRRRGWRRLDAMLDVLRTVLGVAPEDFRDVVRAAWRNSTSVQEAAELLRAYRSAWLNDCPLFVAAAQVPARRIDHQMRHRRLSAEAVAWYCLPYCAASEGAGTRNPLDQHQQDVETVVDLGEWRWVRCSGTRSHMEGVLMQHCGNAGRDWGVVYSLRHRLRRYRHRSEFWMPHLTFVFDGRTLAEARGRANSNPHRKYHRFVVALLARRDLASGIDYVAKRDAYCGGFSAADLSPELQRELIVRRQGDISGFWNTTYAPDDYIGRTPSLALPLLELATGLSRPPPVARSEPLRGLAVVAPPPARAAALSPSRPTITAGVVEPQPPSPPAGPRLAPFAVKERPWEWDSSFFIMPAPLAFPVAAAVTFGLQALMNPRGAHHTDAAVPAYVLGTLFCVAFGLWVNLSAMRKGAPGQAASTARVMPEGPAPVAPSVFPLRCETTRGPEHTGRGYARCALTRDS